jgi:hypothetical protein
MRDSLHLRNNNHGNSKILPRMMLLGLPRHLNSIGDIDVAELFGKIEARLIGADNPKRPA